MLPVLFSSPSPKFTKANAWGIKGSPLFWSITMSHPLTLRKPSNPSPPLLLQATATVPSWSHCRLSEKVPKGSRAPSPLFHTHPNQEWSSQRAQSRQGQSSLTGWLSVQSDYILRLCIRSPAQCGSTSLALFLSATPASSPPPALLKMVPPKTKLCAEWFFLLAWSCLVTTSSGNE